MKEKLRNLFSYRILAILLAMTVLMATLPSAIASADNTLDVWDGTEICPTEVNTDGEFLISTPEHLAYIIKNPTDTQIRGKKFKLTNDIYLNDVTMENWDVPSGDYTPKEWFCSADIFTLDSESKQVQQPILTNINGDGYIIYGIWYPEGNTEDNVGLIPNFRKGKISNLGISRSVIRGNKCVAGFAGILAKASNDDIKEFDNCFVDGSVTITATGDSSGGIVANCNTMRSATGKVHVSITNCYNKAEITAKGQKHNGILGDIWKSSVVIKNCYSVGCPPYYFESDNGRGTVLIAEGLSAEEVLNNNYSDTEVTISTGYNPRFTVVDNISMLGEEAKASMSGLDFVSTFETVAGRTPKLQVFLDNFLSNDEYWKDKLDTSALEGAGEAENPYLIKTESQLANLIKTGGVAGKYYKLTRNMYLNQPGAAFDENAGKNIWLETGADGKGITAFKGAQFDGADYTVNGLYFKKTGTYVFSNANNATALFPNLTASATITIKNVGVADSYLENLGIASGIIGFGGNSNTSNLTIQNCFVESDVKCVAQSAAGIYGAGSVNAEISNCYSKATLEKYGSSCRAAGIAANQWGSRTFNISNCFSTTAIKANSGTVDANTCEENFNVTGANALVGTKLEKNTAFYAVKDDSKMPMLRSYGTAIKDIDENGIYEADKDLPALRAYLVESSTNPSNGDINNSGAVDICDLLAFKKFIG